MTCGLDIELRFWSYIYIYLFCCIWACIVPFYFCVYANKHLKHNTLKLYVAMYVQASLEVDKTSFIPRQK